MNKILVQNVVSLTSLQEFKAIRDWFFGEEGPYRLALGGLPRFPEVRQLNDRIYAWAEGTQEMQSTLIRFLETGDSALLERAEVLRVQTEQEWVAIAGAVLDLVAPYYPG